MAIGQRLNAEYSCRLAQTTEETDTGVAEIQSIMQVNAYATTILPNSSVLRHQKLLSYLVVLKGGYPWNY